MQWEISLIFLIPEIQEQMLFEASIHMWGYINPVIFYPSLHKTCAIWSFLHKIGGLWSFYLIVDDPFPSKNDSTCAHWSSSTYILCSLILLDIRLALSDPYICRTIRFLILTYIKVCALWSCLNYILFALLLYSNIRMWSSILLYIHPVLLIPVLHTSYVPRSSSTYTLCSSILLNIIMHPLIIFDIDYLFFEYLYIMLALYDPSLHKSLLSYPSLFWSFSK